VTATPGKPSNVALHVAAVAGFSEVTLQYSVPLP
jgi:hypothetical protein